MAHGIRAKHVRRSHRRCGRADRPDPRPTQRFFERSDNIDFARRGIPAHTLSTFNLHADYHTVRDEAATLDPVHMARVIDAAFVALRALANAPAVPMWHPGGRP
jgi:Zn-dependent M28 family amino/carboxypeptidase